MLVTLGLTNKRVVGLDDMWKEEKDLIVQGSYFIDVLYWVGYILGTRRSFNFKIRE